MNAVVQNIVAGNEAYLIERALLKRFVLCTSFLSYKARGYQPDVDVVLHRVHHHPLLLQLVKLGLKEVLTFLVVLRHPVFERRGATLLPKGEGGTVGIVGVREAGAHVFIEGRHVSNVNFFQSVLLSGREEGGVDLELGQD